MYSLNIPNFPINFENRQNTSDSSDIIKHFHTPLTTATSVLGCTFNNGVILAADTLGSYGSLARFKNCSRIVQANKNIVLGVGGDIGDFQYLRELIRSKMIGEDCLEDDILLKPASLLCWLTRVLYNRRSKIDPLWNNVLVAGIQNGKPYLGSVDKLGTAVEDRLIATGYGAYIAIPLLRAAVEKKPDLNKQEAEEIMMKCMEVLYYRDCRSYNNYELAIVTPDGIDVKGPIEVKTNWSTAEYVCGYE